MSIAAWWSERRSFLLDLTIVCVTAGVYEWEAFVYGNIPGPGWLIALLPALVALSLLWRRRHALAVAAVVACGIAIQAIASHQSAEGLMTVLPFAFAAYSVGAWASRRQAVAGVAVLGAGYAVFAYEDANVRTGRADQLWATAFFGLGVLVALLIGTFVRAGRERAASQAASAARERGVEAAIVEERSRLARELHDIVSHNLSVVVLQAGGARAQGDVGSAVALEKIERSGREALVEMRRLLGVLRESSDDPAVPPPQPGLAELNALADRVRAAGLPVELTVTGDRAELPPAVQLSIYRIAQEALTNVLKHAGPATARVRIAWTAEEATVVVSDDGRATSNGTGSGQGLTGMRERVALFGGQLEAAPLPRGGFAVRARLPLEASSP
ncbi:MAG: sensor histidine kinase [Gaiellaceae bacterium]